ncbi:MAG: hypothetical protein FWB84_04465 [Candidatus Bathyarchaeota archaeon]|uniref:Kelch repeat-containing protein n=1 Tax=Candidatus Bathycorpusculum sp. TaxID=2994959 RepID=UPI00282F6128|nr:hypothetical protein [Candidatus Termiticorpusculum sp.]MCL2292395.1 hypothetical protein [Candidatus Termiticorpusculum sp.]
MNKIIPFMLLFFFISGTFVTMFNSVSVSSQLVENSWNTKTASPNPERRGLGVVAVDGKIYAIGGFYWTEIAYISPLYRDEHLDINERYDPATDTWVTLEPIPTSMTNFAITEYQGKIYCIGSSNMESCMFEVYDPNTNSWSTKANPPFYYRPSYSDIQHSSFSLYSRNLQAHVVDGKIFVRNFDELFTYDSINDLWIKKTQVPDFDFKLGNDIFSTVVDNKVIFFHAVNSDWPGDRPNNVHVIIYDTKTDKWSEGKTQEIGIGGKIMDIGTTTGVYAPKNVYLFGFKTELQYITWVYNPINNAWSTAKAVPDIGVYGVTEVDDILYVIGGNNYGWHVGGEDIFSLNMQYVPVGYDRTLSSDPSASASEDASSSGASESKPLWASLTVPITAIIVLTVNVTIVISLFFYTKNRKNQ